MAEKMLASPFMCIGTVNTHLNSIQNSTKAKFVCIFEAHVKTSSMFYSKVQRKTTFWSLPFQFSILSQESPWQQFHDQELENHYFTSQVEDICYHTKECVKQLPDHWVHTRRFAYNTAILKSSCVFWPWLSIFLWKICPKLIVDIRIWKAGVQTVQDGGPQRFNIAQVLQLQHCMACGLVHSLAVARSLQCHLQGAIWTE
jgi:hypothetical protein